MNFHTGAALSAGQLREYVAARGYRAEPTTNSWEAANGAPLRVMGYNLLGPRGNRTIVARFPDDTYSFDAVKLWCDGVDYATRQVLDRRAKRQRVACGVRS